LINDRLGYERSVNLRLIYAYPIKISQNSTLAAGFGLGFLNKTLDGTQLKYENQLITDPSGEYSLHSEFKPAIDFGFVYQSPKLKIGTSSTHITNSDKNATFYNVPRHFYLFGSYKIKLNNNLELEPSFFVKSCKVITQYEANSNLIISEKYWLGISYRHKVSMNFLAGMNLNKNIKLAYAYDFDTGKINAYSSGSHEIMIIMAFNKNEKADFYLKTPRLFN